MSYCLLEPRGCYHNPSQRDWDGLERRYVPDQPNVVEPPAPGGGWWH